MALSRVKTWLSGDVLTSSDLNAEFNNILNNALSLISPLTGNLNVNLKQLTNLLFETQASSQTAATEGRVYYQTTLDQVEVDDGANIRRVPTIASVARGDTIVAGSTANQWTRKALGSAGTIWRSDGTDPQYSTATYPNTATASDLMLATGTNAWGSLAVGSANQVVRIPNAGGAPAYGQVNLASSAAVTGSLPSANGGLGGDFSLTAQGNIFYFSAAGTIAALGPGTSGQFLKTQGAGANPTWASATASPKVGTFTRDISLASGTQAVTGVGFQPSAVLFISGNSGAAGTIGLDNGTTKVKYANESGATTSIALTCNTNEAINLTTAGGTAYTGSISSLDADGFTITWTKTGSPTGTVTIGYLAFR